MVKTGKRPLKKQVKSASCSQLPVVEQRTKSAESANSDALHNSDDLRTKMNLFIRDSNRYKRVPNEDRWTFNRTNRTASERRKQVFTADALGTDRAHLKYKAYCDVSDLEKGSFPHPTKAGARGLPFLPAKGTKNELHMDTTGLPSCFQKPLSNTSAAHYNVLTVGDCDGDVYEHRQRELNRMIRVNHQCNIEAVRTQNVHGNSKDGLSFVPGSTKPCGRINFNPGMPEFKFKDDVVKKCMPEGAERKTYEFWR